jgi:hypothetical protein
LNNPLLASSMLGNPLLGNSLLGGSAYGNPSGWGNGLPYNIQGLYSPPGYPGSAASYNPYTNPYSSPYYNPYSNPNTSPYYGNGYGNQPYFRRDSGNPYFANQYYPNQYPQNSAYSGSYHPGPYNAHRPLAQSSDQAAPVVLQPIIVNPGQQELAKPPVTTKPETRQPVSSKKTPVGSVIPGHDRKYKNQSREVDNPLYGHWQGVNGEYLELGSKRFRLRSKDADLKGTYQLKNSILKAAIADRKEPVYMQYRMSDGNLMFRSEDGQLMLFRRLPQSNRPY